ncbi:MAG: hypothetical protein P1U56_21030 [Saprospiraceae bacterium]|nr:hypothetical protein [Saprospiraceae bacterium]
MNSNIFYYVIAVLLLNSCKSEQPSLSYPEYYRGYNEIKVLLNNDQIDEAIVQFDSLTIRVPHVPSSNYFRMAIACAERGKCDLAAKYLEHSLINGKEYGKGMGRNKTIDLCSLEVNQILKKEISIHNEYFNLDYKTKIDSMFVNDQNARSGSNMDEMQFVDSINMQYLLTLIEKYGYPGEKLIGHVSAFNAFILILHMDRDKNNQLFKSILDEAYNNGQIWPRGYAWIIDRRRSWGDENLEPYYYHMPSKNYAQFNKTQIDEINRRRDSIGLDKK